MLQHRCSPDFLLRLFRHRPQQCHQRGRLHRPRGRGLQGYARHTQQGAGGRRPCHLAHRHPRQHPRDDRERTRRAEADIQLRPHRRQPLRRPHLLLRHRHCLQRLHRQDGPVPPVTQGRHQRGGRGIHRPPAQQHPPHQSVGLPPARAHLRTGILVRRPPHREEGPQRCQRLHQVRHEAAGREGHRPAQGRHHRRRHVHTRRRDIPRRQRQPRGTHEVVGVARP